MNTTERPIPLASNVTPEERAELDEAVRRAMSGQRDPEVMRKACERMDRMREELRQKHGTMNIAVDLIRESRGPLDEEQERELTPTQRNLLRRGESRLRDPETGVTYVLVPEREYERLRGDAPAG